MAKKFMGMEKSRVTGGHILVSEHGELGQSVIEVNGWDFFDIIDYLESKGVEVAIEHEGLLPPEERVELAKVKGKPSICFQDVPDGLVIQPRAKMSEEKWEKAKKKLSKKKLEEV